MGAAALGGLPADTDVREQLLHMWSRWLHWATAYPQQRRALAQLEVCDEITAPIHQAASQGMTGIAGILEQSRENGPMRDVPLAFLVALASALADTTIDYIIADPATRPPTGRPAPRPPARPTLLPVRPLASAAKPPSNWPGTAP